MVMSVTGTVDGVSRPSGILNREGDDVPLHLAELDADRLGFMDKQV